jgi:diguanylate cyclase (GGDEF)-like protein
MTDPALPSLQQAAIQARRFRRRLIGIACAACVLILGLALTVAFNARSYQHHSYWTRHSYQVERQILRVNNALRRSEASLRGYLLTGDADRLEEYFTQKPLINSESATLVRLTADNPAQQGRANTLRHSMLERSQQLQQVLRSYQREGANASLALLKQHMDEAASHPIANQTTAIRDAEQILLHQREQQRVHSAKLTTGLTLACLMAMFAMLVIAFVMVQREQRNRLRADRERAKAYADLAQSLNDSRGMAQQMKLMHMLAETLQSCRNMHEALRVISASLPGMLPGITGTVSLINSSRNMVEKAAEWGAPLFEIETVFAPDDCLALRRGHAYPASGMQVNFHCEHLHPDSSAELDCCWLCIPLLAQGETLGVMHIQTSGKELPSATRHLAITIGEQLGLLLGNLKLQETLRIQSIRDPLTGLFNRRYLEVSLTRELLRSARQGRNLAVLMLDMDHFKRFNDTHGHDAGDQLLQQFAAVMKQTIRSEDIACRYGGEEFTVILPETDQATAMHRAEQIRKAVIGMQVRHHGELLGSLTVSIGMALQAPHGNDPDRLLQAADRALYRAKHAGRNRVELADPPGKAVHEDMD